MKTTGSRPRDMQVKASGHWGALDIRLRKPDTRHFDSFVRLRSSIDLLLWSMFPNAKEVTESFAAYDGVRRHLWRRGFRPDDPEVLCVVVGDGVKPRTAATFAVRTKWEVVSVDPLMRQAERWARKVHRLRAFCARIEDTRWRAERAVIVAVHSHADLARAWDVVEAPVKAALAIPCCVPQQLVGRAPDVEYEDFGIWSPERTVRIWNAARQPVSAEGAGPVPVPYPCPRAVGNSEPRGPQTTGGAGSVLAPPPTTGGRT